MAGDRDVNVRRYFAANMRSALDLVRREQGPDALILSNRKLDNGVELITADGDIDEALVQKFADQAQAKAKQRIAARGAAESEVAPHDGDRPSASAITSAAPAERVLADSGESLWSDARAVADMARELSGLKGLIEQQLSGLAWSQYGGKYPTRARLLRLLSRVGITPSLGRELIAELPPDAPFNDGWRLTLKRLESRLKVLDDPILKAGGRFALCGPTGVGKTLLACKLAAHYALRHGPERVALVSTDEQRLGAHQQLKVFGGLLGIAVHTAASIAELTQCLDRLGEKELVIIDTPGAPPGDAALHELVNTLALEDESVASYLVLSATTDYLSLHNILAGTTGLDFHGCMLTKLDEAAVLGPAVSAVVEAGLPVAYLCAGQDVPDDLETPLARNLVERTIALAGDTPSQEDPSAIERAFTIQ